MYSCGAVVTPTAIQIPGKTHPSPTQGPSSRATHATDSTTDHTAPMETYGMERCCKAGLRQVSPESTPLRWTRLVRGTRCTAPCALGCHHHTAASRSPSPTPPNLATHVHILRYARVIRASNGGAHGIRHARQDTRHGMGGAAEEGGTPKPTQLHVPANTAAVSGQSAAATTTQNTAARAMTAGDGMRPLVDGVVGSSRWRLNGTAGQVRN